MSDRHAALLLATVHSATAAGYRIWNGLPDDATSATLLTFRRKLKAHLFRQSYAGIIL